MEKYYRRTTSVKFGLLKLWVDSMKGLSFALMTSSWKADTLFGVSVGSVVGAVATGAEVVIVGTVGGGGYSASPGIAGFERRVAADGSRTRGKSAMSSKRDAAASRLNKQFS